MRGKSCDDLAAAARRGTRGPCGRASRTTTLDAGGLLLAPRALGGLVDVRVERAAEAAVRRQAPRRAPSSRAASRAADGPARPPTRRWRPSCARPTASTSPVFTAYGRIATMRCCARVSRAPATIFMARVIFCVAFVLDDALADRLERRHGDYFCSVAGAERAGELVERLLEGRLGVLVERLLRAEGLVDGRVLLLDEVVRGPSRRRRSARSAACRCSRVVPA